MQAPLAEVRKELAKRATVTTVVEPKPLSVQERKCLDKVSKARYKLKTGQAAAEKAKEA